MSNIPNLAEALVAALADLSVVDTGRTANAGSYSYKYADLADVVKLTRPVLSKHGLVALTPVHDHGTGLACTVTLLHTSGERLDLGPFPFPHGRDAQATGSMVTYHRRYSLLAALGMAAGDDDDGAGAHAATPPAAVWNANTAKQALIDLCLTEPMVETRDEAKAMAADIWAEYGHDLTVFTKDSAQELFDAWQGRPL